jgi:hypothetical protein
LIQGPKTLGAQNQGAGSIKQGLIEILPEGKAEAAMFGIHGWNAWNEMYRVLQTTNPSAIRLSGLLSVHSNLPKSSRVALVRITEPSTIFIAEIYSHPGTFEILPGALFNP